MGCVCFAMVLAFGSIAGCPKASSKKETPKVGDTPAVTPATPSKSASDAGSKDWVKVTDVSGDLKAEKDGTVKVKVVIERSETDKVKEKDVDVTFTVPKDKGIKDIEKVTIKGKDKEAEITLTVADAAKFTADVDIAVEAKVGDVVGKGKITAKKK